jgi:hypothetical protein
MGLASVRLSMGSRAASRAGNTRGSVAEQRAFTACRRLASLWWFLDAKKGTPAQDKIGWDVIVHTRDVGRIILQVKSSQRNADEFIARGKTFRLIAPIHVIVIERGDCDATVFGKVLGACIVAREQALAAGLTADDPRLCCKEAA